MICSSVVQKLLTFSWAVGLTYSVTAQNVDSIAPRTLKEVSIKARVETITRLQPIENGFIWAGKKNEVISLQHIDANIAEKSPRQIFSRVPGLFVYDMDGAGNQMNISTRGLDPHRGWEFNVRTNGILNNSDIYAYPASHFSLPLEAVSKIELVRGAGSLQYGAQFGGMLQYVVKQPDTTRRATLEAIQSVGSFGMLGLYSSIGGKIKKWQYFAFAARRVSEGYRQNSRSSYDAQGLLLKYLLSPNIHIGANLMRSNYLYQLPGPLTDAMFHADPRQATRSRNFYSPTIWIPAVEMEWRPSAQTTIRWINSAVLGDRKSVLFDRPATIRDTINAQTGVFQKRQVDIDVFNSFTSELRILHEYRLLGKKAHLAFNAQHFNNDLNRRQLGRGTTGIDYDLSIEPDSWGRNLHLRSKSIAVAAEQKLQLTSKLSVGAGFRYEYGASRMSGVTTYADENDLRNVIRHNFPLLGLHLEWNPATGGTVYGGISQAYRPVIFKDIIPGSIYEQADRNLKNAYGYNAEIGFRGSRRSLKWDVSVFRMQYNNRLGSLMRLDEQRDTFVLYRTNIGDSRTHGLELYLEYLFNPGASFQVSVFTSTSYMDARYLVDSLRFNALENRSIRNNRVESVPEWISRNGFSCRYRNFSMSVLYSYTGENFADPFNTVNPSPTGAVGLVPAYDLWDLNATWRYKQLTVRFSLNNIANKQYFTKRPLFYPGPGIWPSDGRSFVLSAGIRL